LPVVLFLSLALALYELNISPHGGLTVSVNLVHKPIAPELTRRPRDGRATLTEPHDCASAFEPPHTEKIHQLQGSWLRGFGVEVLGNVEIMISFLEKSSECIDRDKELRG
jgi:hypothetical protein